MIDRKLDTNALGQIAVARVLADLTERGFQVFLPFSDHLRFDLVCLANGRFLRIQVKYSSSGKIYGGTNWASRGGPQRIKYRQTDFDYYAVFLPEVQKVIYPSVRFSGCRIALKPRFSPMPFYWYEDFLSFTDVARKHRYSDFGVNLRTILRNGKQRTPQASRKPTKAVLAQLLWQKPTTEIAKQFGVTDKAVAKWARGYGLNKPPRGYWAKQYARARNSVSTRVRMKLAA